MTELFPSNEPDQSIGNRLRTLRPAASTYAVRLARGSADIRAAQTLRFLVFNLELNEGLENSFLTCRDADRFDEVCDHLVVEDLRTGEIVGTYRLQTGEMARGNLGYYSAQEFDLDRYEQFRPQMLELGRACVHACHRSLAVINLLWRGIDEYARQRGVRFLIGCSSVTSQDPAVGAALYAKLHAHHLAPVEWHTVPKPGLECPLDVVAPEAPKVPKLLRAYLSLGARVCGPPAIDREFKTIDFLTLLDIETLS